MTENKMVCTLNNGNMVILEVDQKDSHVNIRDIRKIPRPEYLGRNPTNMAFPTELTVFKEVGTFMLIQSNGKDTAIFYFPQSSHVAGGTPVQKFISSDMVAQPINDSNTIAVFSQHTESSNRWTIRLYNLADNFREQIYRLENNVFKDRAMVQQVREISKGTYLIAINSEFELKFIKFIPEEKKISSFAYNPLTFLELDSHFCHGLMLSLRSFRELHNNVVCTSAVDVVSLETGLLFSQVFTTLNEVEEGWEGDYLINYSRSTKQELTFKTLKIIKKESLLMKLMK